MQNITFIMTKFGNLPAWSHIAIFMCMSRILSIFLKSLNLSKKLLRLLTLVQFEDWFDNVEWRKHANKLYFWVQECLNDWFKEFQTEHGQKESSTF